VGSLQDSARGGKDENLAVGEDAVYVEQEELDFFGANIGR
jgi:hypothetical protein